MYPTILILRLQPAIWLLDDHMENLTISCFS